jgi:hypothetical protein
MFTIPVYLQSALGYSAFETGLALLPFSVATLAVATISTGWRAYVAPKRLVQAGLALMAVGLVVLLARTDLDLTIVGMVVPMVVVGVGLGLFTGQLVDLTMSAVPASESSVASGVINALSQLGYAFGTAVTGSFLLAGFYGSVVDGVTEFLSRPVAGDQRRRLVVALEDRVDATTQAQQEAFIRGLPPETQEQLLAVVRTAMQTTQRSVLALLVVFVLLTLLAASCLPGGTVTRTESDESE